MREGEIVALLGRNGAGKTTTLRSLIGLTRPRTGKVAVFGADVTGFPPYRIAAAGVGYVPEGRRIFANLTVDENLRVPVERPGPWTVARVYERFPRLAERKTQQGRAALGRRAGDAVDRPRPALEPEAADARRALAGPRAADRRGRVQDRRRGAAAKASRCCWSSRTCARRSRSPIAPTCWTTAGSSTRATRAAFGADEQRVRELAGASAEKWDVDG